MLAGRCASKDGKEGDRLFMCIVHKHHRRVRRASKAPSRLAGALPVGVDGMAPVIGVLIALPCIVGQAQHR